MTANTLAVRRREIDARFWTSDDVCDLPTDSHRMMFVGLWCKADREGRMKDEPGPISRRVRPWDPGGGPVLIDELVRRGLARRYVVDGERYMWLPKFKVYQHPNPHEARSGIPAPPATEEPQEQPMQVHARAIEPPEKTNGAAEISPVVVTDGSQCTSEPSEPSEPSGRKALSSELDLELTEEPAPVSFMVVFEHWRRVMKHPDAKAVAKRKRAVAARFKEGYTAEQLLQAIDGCAQTPHNMGANDRHERYDDLELICRDGAHVERFIRNAKSPPKKPGADPNGGIAQREVHACAVCSNGAESAIGEDGAKFWVCYPCYGRFEDWFTAQGIADPWKHAAAWVAQAQAGVAA